MPINMPGRENKPSPEDIINRAKIGESLQEDLSKTKTISCSLQKRDIIWMDDLIKEISLNSRKKINRTLLITAGLSLLQQKNIEGITEVINRL